MLSSLSRKAVISLFDASEAVASSRATPATASMSDEATKSMYSLVSCAAFVMPTNSSTTVPAI